MHLRAFVPSDPDWREPEVLDLSLPPEAAATSKLAPPEVPAAASQALPTAPEPAGAASEPEAGDWRPEMSPCSNVVVTDVTSNLLTVTIKEFCATPKSPPTRRVPPRGCPQ